MIINHYTSADGIKGIMASGVIAMSTDVWNDAVLGQGVYFTALQPMNGKARVAQNNYRKLSMSLFFC